MKKLIVLGNGNEWCEKSLIELKKKDNVFFTNKYLPINDGVLAFLARAHFCYSINRYFKLPLKRIWYSIFLKYLGIYHESADICILIYDRNILANDFDFIKYIKKIYFNVKFVYIFTNIIKYSGAVEKNYLNKLSEYYDVIFAFDPEDSKKYNFSYSPLIYDPDNIIINKEKESFHCNRVFYLGKAKDRFDMLISCYEKIKSYNIECDFTIVDVPKEKIKYSNDIVYNKYISYTDAVNRIADATCLIDIVQKNSCGLTIKTCEAVCYNKKLITTNRHVKEYPFYDERFIKIIESEEDIDKKFFENNILVEYPINGRNYFSANNFLKRLNEKLYYNKL